MKILMFSGGLDSTYLAWRLLNNNDDPDGVHIHYVSIRNDCEPLWKKEDIITERIVTYFAAHNLQFKFSKSKFEFFGQPSVGFDSDLILVVAQKLCMNAYGKKIDVLFGWNPYDLTRREIALRSENHITQNIWKALVASTNKRHVINEELQFPLLDWNVTKDIMIKEMPKELVDLTWSCRQRIDVPCGKCHSCIERKHYEVPNL